MRMLTGSLEMGPTPCFLKLWQGIELSFASGGSGKFLQGIEKLMWHENSLVNRSSSSSCRSERKARASRSLSNDVALLSGLETSYQIPRNLKPGQNMRWPMACQGRGTLDVGLSKSVIHRLLDEGIREGDASAEPRSRKLPVRTARRDLALPVSRLRNPFVMCFRTV